MPATDGFGEYSLARPAFVKDAHSQAPQMSSGAKQAVKDSGGWTHFVQSYGGKAHDAGDREGGKADRREDGLL